MRSQITHTHRSHVFPEMTDNSNHEEYYNSCFFKPSEIVYSESLHQGEWVKLLNRIHSDWLNWSKAKTDLQDLRDSGHWASKSKTASTENAQTTILMGNNNLAWPKANTEMYNIKVLGLSHHSTLYLKHGIIGLRHLLIIALTSISRLNLLHWIYTYLSVITSTFQKWFEMIHKHILNVYT